jgi:hemolysin activation/secretion protein
MRWIYFGFLFVGVSALAAPPPVPSAGVVERELEKEYEAKPLEPEKEIPQIQIDIPEEKLEMPEGISVVIEEIEIRGNTVFSCQQISQWISCREQELNLQQIYEICETINREYAKRGYFLARAYPPPQTIEQGLLVIEILEGRLGEIILEGNRFYSDGFICGYFERLRGRPLQYDSFLRALLLLNEVSDLETAAVFSKGKEVGTADVIVQIQDKRPLHLYLNGNNYGKDLTTNFRVGGRVDAGSLGVYGDKLSIAEVVGFPINALYFTDVVYRVPLNRNGTFFELAYLFSKFKVEELLSLRLKGVSNIGTLKATHAMVRTRQMSLDLFGYFDIKQIQNYSLGRLTSFDKLRVATLGSLLDRFATRDGRDYLNLRFAVGIPSFLGAMAPVDSECSRAGAGGLFVKFNADYDHLQILAKDCIFSFHGSGQWSPFKLAIPEQIYIGGADTVRGFPLASALGDSGYYLNLELKLPPLLLANQRFFVAKKKWREVMQIVAFVDHGGVSFHGGSDTFLWGSGLGFRFKGPRSLSLSLDVGFPLNHNSLSAGAMTYIKVTGQPF